MSIRLLSLALIECLLLSDSSSLAEGDHSENLLLIFRETIG